MIQKSISLTNDGALAFAGVDVRALVEKYGTPRMIYDENRRRENMRTYIKAMREAFVGASLPAYASKAFSCKEIYHTWDSIAVWCKSIAKDKAKKSPTKENTEKPAKPYSEHNSVEKR